MLKQRTLNGAVAAEELEDAFPTIDLPIAPPYPPMDAAPADTLP